MPADLVVAFTLALLVGRASLHPRITAVWLATDDPDRSALARCAGLRDHIVPAAPGARSGGAHDV